MAALHELNLAALFCDRICILKDGRIQALGKPHEVITEETLYKTYGVHSMIHCDEHAIPHVRSLVADLDENKRPLVGKLGGNSYD